MDLKPEKVTYEIFSLLQEISANIQVLGISGFVGVVLKALIAPEEKWKRRISQALAGFMSAIFLGSILANLIEPFVSDPVYAWLASGFLCGFSGEAAMSYAQRKFLSPEDKKTEEY